MSRRGALLGLTLSLVLTGAACGGDDDEGAAPEDETTETPAAGGEGPPGPNSITLKLVKFKPEELAVPVGTEVTWVQDDVPTHTVTSGTVEKSSSGAKATSDGRFDSGNIGTGEDFTYTFAEAGEFPYYCAVHPATMTGVVRVE